MGCLESCFKNPEDEENERSRLLPNEHNPVQTAVPVSVGGDQLVGTPDEQLSRSADDEQSVLNDILSKYSSDVIDVTAIDTRIDCDDYLTRGQMYNRHITALSARFEIPKPSLRSVCEDPVSLLSGPPPKFDNLMIAAEISETMETAMKNVKVTRKDDLTIDLARR